MGKHPWRVEAESMMLYRYTTLLVTLCEAASSYTAINTSSNTTARTPGTKLEFAKGRMIWRVKYFDVAGGRANVAIICEVIRKFVI